MEAPTGSGIELAVVRRFVDVAVDALADAREEIDALNVYPVPDGDTGTNMYLTMSAARDAIHEAVAQERDLGAALDRVPRGARCSVPAATAASSSARCSGAIALRIARAEPRGAQRRGDGRGDAPRPPTRATPRSVRRSRARS